MKKFLLLVFILSIGFTAYSQDQIPDSLLSGNKEKVCHLLLYPNPVKYHLTVEFDLEYTGEVTMRVLDSTGEIVFNEELDYKQGVFEKQKLNLTHLESGVYYLNLRFGDNQVMKKFNKRYLRK